SGLEMLVTNKLSWNQHNRLPSSTCWWQGMDGSKVLLHLLTTPRDVQHLPFPTNYKSDLTAREVRGTITNASQPAMDNLPICFGYGDGGGGPTEELIARAKAYESIPAMPKVRMGRAADFLAKVKSVSAGLPSWQDELYMEGHRGVLTSQGWIKRANRRAEAALHRAELLAVMGGETQQSEEVNDAWKLLCLNQFHDTLSGTAIGKVFAEARLDYQRIDEICAASEAAQLNRLSGPLGVLNPSPLSRHSLGLVADPVSDVTSQQVADGYLVDLPPLVGYGTATLGPTKSETPPLTVEEKDGSILIENAFLRCELGADGTVHAAYCKSSRRDLLAAGERGNQLWAFEDRPISWDAWDIDPFFEDRGEEIVDVTSMRVVESGPLRVAVRVERTYRQSRIVQFIRLTDRSARLEFATQIDWHQQHTLLKAAFPLGVVAKNATYQIQWGHIERSTGRDTRRDASRFEVCGHKWAALHDGSFGVGLINDGKYGHDTHGSTMRLTLIKSSTMPDPQADQGHHAFTYALMPEGKAGFETIRAEAEALNHPLLIAPGLGALPGLVHCDASNVIIETVKPSEEGRGYVLRLYEAEGRPTNANLNFATPPVSVLETDLLEQTTASIAVQAGQVELDFAPFQIRTLLVERAD
ncbi:MAG: alpha-mannosidase, partial [Rhizobiaceae bacterium]|nr:alpha-mannosidase [Rhizobiaceae bacterium]